MKNEYEIRGNQAVIFLKRRSGEVLETIISLDDLEKAKELNGSWYPWWNKRSFYVVGTNQGKKIYLHRFITKAPCELVVDHINHDTLDNSRENLRLVTQGENLQNRRGPQTDSTSSGIRGVVWDRFRNKWRAQAKLNRKSYNLGRYDTIEEAEAVVKEFRAKHMPYSQEALGA